MERNHRNVLKELTEYRLFFMKPWIVVYDKYDGRRRNYFLFGGHQIKFHGEPCMLEGLSVNDTYGFKMVGDRIVPMRSRYTTTCMDGNISQLCNLLQEVMDDRADGAIIDRLQDKSRESRCMIERIRNSVYFYESGNNYGIKRGIFDNLFYTRENILRLYDSILENEKAKIRGYARDFAYNRRSFALKMWWYSWLI